MTASLNTAISQWIPMLAFIAANTATRQPVNAMTSPLDSLTQQLVPLKVLGNSPSATNSSAVQATVLSSTALVSNSQAQAQYKVLLDTGSQKFEITSKTAFPINTLVQIKISADQQSAVLSTTLNTGVKKSLQSKAGISQNISTGSALNTSTITNSTSTSSSNTISGSETNRSHQVKQIINQAIRHSLPQQKPLRDLVLLLQQINTNEQFSPNKRLSNQLGQLLASFPSAEKLQQPLVLKKAFENSGVFLESKLALNALKQLASQNNQTTPKADQITNDVKALLQRISNLVQPSTPSQEKNSQSTQHTEGRENGNFHTTTSYLAHQGIQNNNPDTATENKEKNVDILLRQLGKQLLSSIARTQINQLESLNNRQPATSENPGAVNTWVTEIPIINGKQVDNLEIRIEQQEQENNGSNEEKKQKLWTVMLSFDLHAMGKMAVQLQIMNLTVAATVWSSKKDTHNQVQENINELSSSLQKIGVAVKHIDCQLGLPTSNKKPLSQQLVDVRT